LGVGLNVTPNRRTNATSKQTVTIEWERETPDFAYETYSLDHDWRFDAGVTVRAIAASCPAGMVNVG
jgi:hypothetical protein